MGYLVPLYDHAAIEVHVAVVANASLPWPPDYVVCDHSVDGAKSACVAEPPQQDGVVTVFNDVVSDGEWGAVRGRVHCAGRPCTNAQVAAPQDVLRDHSESIVVHCDATIADIFHQIVGHHILAGVKIKCVAARLWDVVAADNAAKTPWGMSVKTRISAFELNCAN